MRKPRVIERNENSDKLCTGKVHIIVFANGRVQHGGKCDCAKFPWHHTPSEKAGFPAQ